MRNGQKLEQTLHRKNYMNDQKAHEISKSFIVGQAQIKTTMSYYHMNFEWLN